MIRKKSSPLHQRHTRLEIFAGLAILTMVLTGCALNFPSASVGNPDTIRTDDLIPPLVTVQFNLTLPAPLASTEGIVLEILDEVTGLPYNIQQYLLSQVSDLQYTTSIPFPTGSVVKYRYTKIGAGSYPEATVTGGEVRYRLVLVEGDLAVDDRVQFWQDTPLPVEIETGKISGQVISAENSAPLADILVSAAGQLTLTDANGHFALGGISTGSQNMVFYALDGAFETFQQGAVVAANQVTPINLSLSPRNPVEVTFYVTPPNEARGVPLYLAGNILQLGNTFADLPGGMSIDPNRLPMAIQQDDGTYKITLSLYAGLDLRYKFTLGDGYWNAERDSTSGGWQVRQLIVPDQDVAIDMTIDSWRSTNSEPITFEISVPTESNPGDEKFIQFNNGQWTAPLPLWPLGNGNYLYILFSPTEQSVPIAYRFCRNENCVQALNAEALEIDTSSTPTDSAQTVQVTLDSWANWQTFYEPTEIIAANIPVKDAAYLTQIELSPEMDASWRTYAPIGLSTLAEINANSVQFTPQWFLSDSSLSIRSEIGHTPFTNELKGLINSARSFGLSVSLFPQIGPTEDLSSYWTAQDHSAEWWDSWFESYRTFVLNYARIAAEENAAQLVLGGKALLPVFTGGTFLDGSPSNVPDTIDVQWRSLISEIRKIYSGQLVWATNVQVSADPLPSFIDQFDKINVSVDAPLSDIGQAEPETIADTFWNVIESQIYPMHEQTGLPVILAFGYPATADALEGCLIIDDICSNDGLFLPSEVADSPVDLDLQVQIYNNILPVAADPDWVSGLSIRGYNPVVSLMDGSSSIAGKPARDVIWYWFNGLHPTE